MSSLQGRGLAVGSTESIDGRWPGAAASSGARRLLPIAGIVLATAVAGLAIGSTEPGPAVALWCLLLAGAILCGAHLREESRRLAARCRALEARLDAQAELLDRERRLAVAVVASEAAHDLGSPIRYLERMLTRLASRESSVEEEVHKAGLELTRCRRVLAALRTVRGSERLVETNRLTAVLEHAIDTTPELRGLSRPPSLEVPSTLGVSADPHDVTMLFACLLRNAARAAMPSGEVKIHSQCVDGNVAIEVWNSGAEIGDPDGLFELWASLRPDGRGLGLVMAAAIADRNGWSLAHGRRDGGTTFKVTIPADDVCKGEC